jgi:signal transduction histidine kinase
LHPPELELLGLTAALGEQIQQYHQPQDKGLQVTIQTPSPLPQLPIAVESAAYYIALEALNNVARHAGAQHCTLRLNSLQASTSSAVGVVKTAVLELEITDDGCGLAGDETKKAGGLGLTSMRERATELGGTCLVESSPAGGTRVYARLPCR